MKRFKKLPVILGIVLSVMLVFGGVAYAAYNFLSFDSVVTVDEPMTVQIDGTGIWWLGDTVTTVEAGDSFPIEIAYPGEYQNIPIIITNASYEDLTAHMSYTVTGPDISKVTLSSPTSNLMTSGVNVAGGRSGGAATECIVNVKVENDAPIGTYTVTITFDRY